MSIRWLPMPLLRSQYLLVLQAFFVLSMVTWGLVGGTGGMVMLIVYVGPLAALAGVGVNALVLFFCMKVQYKTNCSSGFTRRG